MKKEIKKVITYEILVDKMKEKMLKEIESPTMCGRNVWELSMAIEKLEKIRTT